MNKHITKTKGDIGLTKVIADLTEKGYSLSLPISEHLPYDLIAEDEGGTLLKIQVKYRANGSISNKTVHINSKGEQVIKKYRITDFNYYAIYLPDINECVYIPNIDSNGMVIRTTIPNSYVPYHWWEDYRLPNRVGIAPLRKISDI